MRCAGLQTSVFLDSGQILKKTGHVPNVGLYEQVNIHFQNVVLCRRERQNICDKECVWERMGMGAGVENYSDIQLAVHRCTQFISMDKSEPSATGD